MTKCIRLEYFKSRITSVLIFDIFLWISVAAAMTYLLIAGQPRVRGFFCDDNSIKYPDRRDTVSTTLLVIIGFTIFFLVLLFVEVLNCIDRRSGEGCLCHDSAICCIKAYLLLMLGFVCQQLVVQVVKQQTGVLRPNFWEVCQPVFNRSHCSRYISDYTCDNTNKAEVRTSRESFPSGHAAFSMYVAIYLCFYIHHRLKIQFSRAMKPLLQFGLVFISIICGQGRIVDNKHHMSDVIAGHLLGFVAAAVVFKSLGNKIFSGENNNEQVLEMIPIETETTSCCACADLDSEACATPSSLIQNDYISVNARDSSLSLQKSDRMNGRPIKGTLS